MVRPMTTMDHLPNEAPIFQRWHLAFHRHRQPESLSIWNVETQSLWPRFFCFNLKIKIQSFNRLTVWSASCYAKRSATMIWWLCSVQPRQISSRFRSNSSARFRWVPQRHRLSQFNRTFQAWAVCRRNNNSQACSNSGRAIQARRLILANMIGPGIDMLVEVYWQWFKESRRLDATSLHIFLTWWHFFTFSHFV